MNIPGWLMLTLGCIFAVLYGVIISLGWAVTRKYRRLYQKKIGLSYIPFYDLDLQKKTSEKPRATVSLQSNMFVTPEGKKINPDFFEVYLSATDSIKYPKVKVGDLIFVTPTDRTLAYVFEVPDLTDFR